MHRFALLTLCMIATPALAAAQADVVPRAPARQTPPSCPMPVFDSRGDVAPMPVAVPDSSRHYFMKVFPARCHNPLALRMWNDSTPLHIAPPDSAAAPAIRFRRRR